MSRQRFISNVSDWAASQPDVLGVALIGSYARGTEQADSDIDFVLIAVNPGWLLETHEWFESFGDVRAVGLEDYGLVRSRRVWYEDGTEVEFGITTSEWLNTSPIDEGSRRVMSEGHRILDDKAGLFAAFVATLLQTQAGQED